MKTYMLYHAGCVDGLVAAWIARGVLGTEDCDYIPVHHGQPAPEIEPNSCLYILDFCYPLEQMEKWTFSMSQVVVLDHHKTAMEAMEKLLSKYGPYTSSHRFIFNMNKSGGRLAWEYFHSTSSMTCPGIVDYTEDRDLWRWKMPGSREVNACLRSYTLSFETLDKLGKLNYRQLYMEMFSSGEAILRREKQIIDQHIQFAKPMELFGHKDIMVVNATVLTSEITGELAKDRPFAASYFDSKEGKRIWSLRSDENGIDVSQLAKSMGGGGHVHAAGFTEEIK